MTHLFLSKDQIRKSRYLLQFKLTSLVIIGVLVSFALQGYALYSIFFSTVFQFLSYWFIYCFFKDVKRAQSHSSNTLSLKFVKTGLWLGLLSTVVPVAIGVLSARGLTGTEVYESLVYTFLHLQYNGWFLFVAFGLFYKFLENNKISYHPQGAIRFYWLFTVAVIPAITLSLLGMSFSGRILFLAYFAAALQALGLVFFTWTHRLTWKALLSMKSHWMRLYFMAFLLLFSLKVVLQCLSVFPMFSAYAFGNKLVILAYLHLSLIGVITFAFLALMINMKWLSINLASKVGNTFLVIGFVTTESLLVLGGLEVFYNHTILFTGSAFMAIGVLALIVSPQNPITS